MSSDEDGDLVFSSGLNLTKRNKLLKRFVPVQLFANSSVRSMKVEEMTFRRVKILECVVSMIIRHIVDGILYTTPGNTLVRSRFNVKHVKKVLV